MKWSPEQTAWLKENYPLYGKVYCIQHLGLTEPQVRAKAARMGLVARGVSAAWRAKQAQHAQILRGRKRPEQGDVLRALHAAGKLRKTPEQRAAVSVRMKAWIAEHGHSRGALGMHHTAEARRRISVASRAAALNRTPAEAAAIAMKSLRTRVARGTQWSHRVKASWKAGWREIGDSRNFYRSRWEANYARYLEWLRAAGQIRAWAHEPRTFWFESIQRGCRSYLPDFCVTEMDGSEVYHEVKGWMDARSKTKIARMAKYYPEVRLVVIREKQYREIGAKLAACIEGWEA